MRLTASQRETVRAMFGGRCAYCGELLGERWHADHFEPVRREWWKPGSSMEHPERHRDDNLMPSCPPCNLDKHAMDLESWRRKLEGACGVLTRNQPTYRHAKRFGLVAETGARVVFHFERDREAPDARTQTGATGSIHTAPTKSPQEATQEADSRSSTRSGSSV